MPSRTSYLLVLIAILAIGSIPFLGRHGTLSDHSLSLISSANAIAVGNKAKPQSLLHRRAPAPQRKGKKRGKKRGKTGKRNRREKEQQDDEEKAADDAKKGAQDAKKAVEEALAQEQQRAIDKALQDGEDLDDADAVADLVNGVIEDVNENFDDEAVAEEVLAKDKKDKKRKMGKGKERRGKKVRKGKKRRN